MEFSDCRKRGTLTTEPNEKALVRIPASACVKEVHSAAFALPNYVKEMLNE